MDNKIVYSYIEEIGKRLAEPNLYGAASVMVGAGFSKNAQCLGDKKQLPPDWEQLAKNMFDELYPTEKDNHNKKLAECSGKNVLTIAQKYEVAFDRQALNKVIERNIADEMYAPSELHTKLMQLNWNDVFTTNYDTLLERALKQTAGKQSYRIVYSQEDLLGSVRPRLVKLHGSIGHSDNYIITEEDYRTYPNIYAPFVNTVQQSMLETRLCLIGFSGNDPNFLSWLGWLRDNLGNNCPSIYLCGIFDDLDYADRRMLERRNITIVDLADLVSNISCNTENKYYQTLNKFLELLSQKSIVKTTKFLQQKPYRTWKDKEKASNMLKQYTEKMLLLSAEVLDAISSYICIPKKQREEIGNYFNNQLTWILVQDNFEQKIQLIDNYCEILLKCNQPLYDSNANKLHCIITELHDNISSVGNTLLYILQMYRIDANVEDYLRIQKKCEESILAFSTSMRDELYIEFSKWQLSVLNVEMAHTYIQKIEDIRNDECALKKACLLVQIGDLEQAREIVMHVISFITQQKYSDNKSASLYGYINLIARSTWDFTQNLELFSDQKYWQNEFNCRKILMDSKEEMISVLFESKEEQNCKKYLFNPNSYTTSLTYGYTNENKRIESAFQYLLLQDYLCIGVYDDHKNTVAIAIELTTKTSNSPLWKWYRVLTIGDKKYSDNYFTRMQIYETDLEYINIFFDRLISLAKYYFNSNTIKKKFHRLIAYEIFDVISRLSIVVDEDRIIHIISLLTIYNTYEKDEHERRHIISTVLNRIKFGFNTNILLKSMENLWDNELQKYDFLNYFNDIVIDTSVMTKSRLENIKSDILKGLHSDDKILRSDAVIKYKIFEGVLSEKDIQSLKMALWEKTDEYGLPQNSAYLPIAWIHEEEHSVCEKIRAYLLNPYFSKSVNGKAILSHNDSIYDIQYYFNCLYCMMTEKRIVELFNEDELCHLLNYFCDYIENEKVLLNEKYNILDESYRAKERFISINNIVLLLCIYANIHQIVGKNLIYSK